EIRRQLEHDLDRVGCGQPLVGVAAERPGHGELALRHFDVGANDKLGRLSWTGRDGLGPPADQEGSGESWEARRLQDRGAVRGRSRYGVTDESASRCRGRRRKRRRVAGGAPGEGNGEEAAVAARRESRDSRLSLRRISAELAARGHLTAAVPTSRLQ